MWFPSGAKSEMGQRSCPFLNFLPPMRCMLHARKHTQKLEPPQLGDGQLQRTAFYTTVLPSPYDRHAGIAGYLHNRAAVTADFLPSNGFLCE